MSKQMPLYTLFFTTLVSVTGDVMAALAIPWFVLQTTGNAVQTGIVAFFSVSPIVLATVFGGPWVDRIGFKRVSVFADFASGITILLIPLLYTTVGLAFWQLLMLVFLGNLLDAPGRSARIAMIPELAKAAGMSLDRATSIVEAISRATGMIGAPIAGILIAATGPLNVLWLDAATFLISALGVQIFIPAALVKIEDKAISVSYLQELRAGFRFVRQNTLVLSFAIIIMLTNMIDAAMSSVTLPVYVDSVYGDALSLGLIIGTFGAAALVGTVFYSWYGNRFSRRLIFIAAFFILSLRFFFLMVSPPFWVLLIVIGLTGLAAGPINPIITVTLYKRIPQQMRAHVFGLVRAGVLIAMPLGALFAGYALEIVGIEWTLFFYGIIYLLATLIWLVLPSTKELDDTIGQVTESKDEIST